MITLLVMASISGCLVHAEQQQHNILQEVSKINVSMDSLIPEPAPERESYPVPSYVPETRVYEIDRSGDIWKAKNPSSYVTPQNEWVRYYASQLFVDTDGRIKYKDEIIPWLVDKDKNVVLWTNKEFYNNYDYSIYKEYYGVTDRNNLPWLMPDFYLYHGNRGVCSAWATAVTSMMLSGEMSLKEGDRFIKQVIPARTVLGYTTSGLRDAWAEYQAYNKTWITSTMMMKIPFQDIEVGGMLWEEKGISEMKAVYEFDNTYLRSVIT